MNIAIDVSQMCYEGTGVARYVEGLTEALLREESSHTFTLFAGTLKRRKFFTARQTHAPWNQADWKILPLPPKLAGYLFNYSPLPFEWLVGQADLLHTSDWAEPFTHLPTVTTIHDLVFKKYPETVDPLIRRMQERRLERIREHSTEVIADSESTKKDLVESYGLSPARITVIYPGISPLFSPQSAKEIDRVKKKYNLPDHYLLSVGTQEPRKNISRLIEACQSLSLPVVLTGK